MPTSEQAPTLEGLNALVRRLRRYAADYTAGPGVMLAPTLEDAADAIEELRAALTGAERADGERLVFALRFLLEVATTPDCPEGDKQDAIAEAQEAIAASGPSRGRLECSRCDNPLSPGEVAEVLCSRCLPLLSLPARIQRGLLAVLDSYDSSQVVLRADGVDPDVTVGDLAARLATEGETGGGG